MHVVQGFHGFQFYDNRIFNNNISQVVSDGDSIVEDLNRLLLLCLKPLLLKLVAQCVLVNLFKESGA